MEPVMEADLLYFSIKMPWKDKGLWNYVELRNNLSKHRACGSAAKAEATTLLASAT